MKALLRALFMILIAFAIFSAFSGDMSQAFGSVGRPAPAPCQPPAQGNAAYCAK